jgi:hypothetical protein
VCDFCIANKMHYFPNLPRSGTAFLTTQAPLWREHIVAGCTGGTIVHEKRISENIVNFDQAKRFRCCGT